MTPGEAKAMSYEIKNYDNQQWSAAASDYIETALKNKFAQNDYCRSYLISTGTKHLCEATKDMLWGTGITLTNPDSLNFNMWKGRNLMGRTLEMIRAELN